MTAMRCPWSCVRILLSSVVLPEPRNPVMTCAGHQRLHRVQHSNCWSAVDTKRASFVSLAQLRSHASARPADASFGRRSRGAGGGGASDYAAKRTVIGTLLSTTSASMSTTPSSAVAAEDLQATPRRDCAAHSVAVRAASSPHPRAGDTEGSSEAGAWAQRGAAILAMLGGDLAARRAIWRARRVSIAADMML